MVTTEHAQPTFACMHEHKLPLLARSVSCDFFLFLVAQQTRKEISLEISCTSWVTKVSVPINIIIIISAIPMSVSELEELGGSAIIKLAGLLGSSKRIKS